MFQNSALHPTKFSKSNEDCPHCGLHFEVEPGLFWGAMYVSYAFSVAIIVTLWFSLNFLLHVQELWIYITTICVALVLFTPFSFRYSRMLMLYWFSGVEYRGKAATK